MDTIFSPNLANAGRSKYKALADALRKAVADGALTEGDRLPPVRELAYRCGVTPGTVARAYSLLIDEGLLEAGVGRGTFVAGAVSASRPPRWPEAVSLRTPVLPDGGQGALLRDALRRIAEGGDMDALLDYPGRDNDGALRKALHAAMAGLPIGNFDAGDIVLAHGGQSAMLAVLQTVLKGSDPVVLIEAEAYPGFRRAASLCRARVISIACDGEGPLVSEIEAAARDEGAQIFLTSAEVNNPTLRCTSGERRREIAAVARRYGLHVLDDDCYRLNRPGAESYRALLPDLGWYVSSMSKSFGPGLRVGWAIGPEGRAPDLVRSVAYGCFGVARPLTELAYHVLTDSRYGAVLAAARRTMGQRVRQAVNHLGGHDVTWHEDIPLLWISLPLGWRASRFVRAAQAQGVLLKSSEEFVAREARAPHCVRLAVDGRIAEGCFERAVDKVRNLLDNPQEELTV
ncbi:PLP-dependent aminotransferase family protein [uncultured Roseovarius sp.]|uniref:aminotransferase-like domain-containing protein n=1 Tax=uncultured Roseovarius sp. TaxID=293344 RepID=UPI002624A8F7|nr:PLP-dependent aminotransferase family protein [uncultured Roseovarius sp.]